MSNPTVYVETTVVGHIAARQQSDIIVAARQLSSRRWWDIRERFRLVVSQIVVDECSAGDSFAASERLQLIDGIQVLAVSADSGSSIENKQCPALLLGIGIGVLVEMWEISFFI